MSRPTIYHLRWRGQQSGPFPLDRILAKLDAHEIGTLHEVLIGDRWMTVQDLLDQISPAKPAEDSPSVRMARGAASAGRSIATGEAHPEYTTRGRPGIGGASPRNLDRGDKIHPFGETHTSARRRRVFAILGLTTGYLGIHNFYAGHFLRGAAQLVLTGLTLWLGFGLIASWLWALVEVGLADRATSV